MRVKKLVGVFTALAIALMTAVIAVPSAAASGADEQFANRLYVLINDYRAQHALQPLRVNAQMAADSQAWTQHSADIANSSGAGTFVHSPGSYAFHENIVWNMSADAAFSSWVNSAPHRANMLIAGATDIGIGAVQLTAGPNRGTFLATAQFGWSNVSADQEAAIREAERVAKEKAAAAAAAAAAQAAAEQAAADRAAAEAAAQAAAQAQAAEQAAAADAAAKAAAEKAAADAAANPGSGQAETDKAAADKAAADKAARDAAEQQAAEAAEAAAAQAAQDEAARTAAEQTAVEQAAAEQAAAEEAARTAVATEAALAEAAAEAAAEQAAAGEAAAVQTRADTVAAEQAKAKASTATIAVASLLDQVTLGNESLLTPALRGTVAAQAAGSRLTVSGLEAGVAFETVIPAAGVNLGAVTADAAGGITLTVPPVLAAGEHKVALFKDTAITGWATFTVEPAVSVLAAQSVPADGSVELAATGLNAAQISIGGIGALMALTGAAALIAVQRQRSVSVR